MIENTYIKEFKEREFMQASAEFWDATAKNVTAGLASAADLLQRTFAEVFEKTAELQELGRDAAGQIALSILHVSVWDGTYRARIDVYDQDQTFGVLLYTQDMDVSWLFAEWEGFFDKLRQLAGDKGQRGILKDPVLRCMMEDEISQLAVYLSGLLKYMLMEACRFENFARMKRKPRFYISVGEYQDWQKALYVELPEVDLLNPPEEFPLMWQRICGRTYKGQNFVDLDLSHACFTECEFIHCTFARVILNDVCFTECTFRNVSFLSGTMYGAAFLDSKLTNVDFSGIKMKWIPFEGTSEENEIFREVIMDGCEKKDVKEGEEQ